MLASTLLSWWSAQGIVEAPYGVPQVVLFVGSIVNSGFCAFKAWSGKNIWAKGVGYLVSAYIAVLFYLLFIM